MTPNIHLSFPLDFPTSLSQEYQKPTWTIHGQLTVPARGSCRASGISTVLPGLPPPHQRPGSPGSMSALSLLPLFSRPPPLPRSDLHTGYVVLSCSVMADSLWPMDCSPPGSSVHGILQARILEWAAISSFIPDSEPLQQLPSWPSSPPMRHFAVSSCNMRWGPNTSIWNSKKNLLFWIIRASSSPISIPCPSNCLVAAFPGPAPLCPDHLCPHVQWATSFKELILDDTFSFLNSWCKPLTSSKVSPVIINPPSPNIWTWIAAFVLSYFIP